MDDCSCVPVCAESVCVRIAIGMDDCSLVPVCVCRERVQDLRKLERDFYVAKMHGDEDL